MNKLNLNLPKLRQSQKILSKQQLNKRSFKFCCCHDQLQPQQNFTPTYQFPPAAKISIKKMRKRSQLGGHHSNSSISLSKNSNRSNIASKRALQYNGISYSGNMSDNHGSKTTMIPTNNNITFAYSNRNLQNKNGNYNGMEYVKAQPLMQPNTQLMYAKPKINNRVPLTNTPLNQSIEQEFKNILDIGDSLRQQYHYGQPFPLDNPQGIKPKNTPNINMPHFSFGQNQKDQFMSKYLNVKQTGKSNGAQIVEQKQSKSSKSSGQVFIRGTFNKNTVNGLTKKRDLLYEYKSQSDISVESSQSLVIESYQNIMRKRESFIRNQY